MKIYVVFGYCGVHEDSQEWMVKAFFDEDQAKSFAKLAEEQATAFYKLHGRSDDVNEAYSNMDWDLDFSTECDNHMQIDYTGTSYCVRKVDLFKPEGASLTSSQL